MKYVIISEGTELLNKILELEKLYRKGNSIDDLYFGKKVREILNDWRNDGTLHNRESDT